MKKKCSICEEKEAYLEIRSLITKIKAYYCKDCYLDQCKLTIAARVYNKSKIHGS